MISDNDLLKYAVDNGIIDLRYIQQQIEMDKRQKILKLHPYKPTFNEKKGRWITRFKVNNEMVQRSRKTKGELEDLIIEFYNNGNKFEDEDFEEKYTFAEAHSRWLEMQEEYGKSSNTIYKYEADWRKYFADSEFSHKDIILITPHDIEGFMIEQIKKHNMKRQAGVTLYGYVNGVFYNAIMDRKIPKADNPCDLVDKKRFNKFYNRSMKSPEMRVLSKEEISKLVAKINDDITERPTSLFAYGTRLSLLTGMRTGEICGLRWENVKDDRIIICESEKFDQKKREYYMSDTKTDKYRTLPMTEELRLFLNDMKALQAKYGITEDFVISIASGKLHTRNLSDYMIKTSKKLGFEISKNIHAIRRTFNSYMRQGGTTAVMAGSIIGNTAEVNNNHYTYDICDIDTKCSLVTDVESRMLGDLSFA